MKSFITTVAFVTLISAPAFARSDASTAPDENGRFEHSELTVARSVQNPTESAIARRQAARSDQAYIQQEAVSTSSGDMAVGGDR